MTNKQIAYIFLGVASSIGLGVGIYFYSSNKRKNAQQYEFPTETGSNNAVSEANHNNSEGDNNTNNQAQYNNGGGSNAKNTEQQSSNTFWDNLFSQQQSASNTVWNSIFLPNRAKTLDSLPLKARKLFQYTINQVYQGSDIAEDGAIGPMTRKVFYYVLKDMFPSIFTGNASILENNGDIKKILGKYKLDWFIKAASGYLANGRKGIIDLGESQLESIVNKVPPKRVGLSGFFIPSIATIRKTVVYDDKMRGLGMVNANIKLGELAYTLHDMDNKEVIMYGFDSDNGLRWVRSQDTFTL